MIDIEEAHTELQDPRLKKDEIKIGVSRTSRKVRDQPDICASIIPENIHVFVKTWGCSHNTSDSEYMAGILSKFGYQVSLDGCCSANKEGSEKENISKYQVVIFNSCTVKGPSEDHFRNDINEARKHDLKIIVAGCVPQSRPNAEYFKDISIIGVQQIDRILEVIESTLNGFVVRFLDEKHDKNRVKTGGARLDLPKMRKNELIEIIAISTGCLNSCTYCKTKHARGELGSYPMEDIVQRAVTAFSEGVKEIWLTSEDLGAYGHDLKRVYTDESQAYARWYKKNGASTLDLSQKFPKHYTLADLLARLIPTIPDGCMLRMGMTNPPYILNLIDEICFLLSYPKVYSFIHIPVQSCSNEVLKVMRREYTRENFCLLVDKLLAYFGSSKSISIATDIICGFPNETDADFRDTVEVMEKYKFPALYVNQFFARPGTPAANMKRVCSTEHVKKRTAELHNLFRTYRTMDHLLGKRVRVLITEISSDKNYLVGHTKCYQQVLVQKDFSLMGKVVEVEIEETQKFFCKAKIIESSSENKALCMDDKDKVNECYFVAKNVQPVDHFELPSERIISLERIKNLPLIEMSLIALVTCWVIYKVKK